MRWCQDNGYVKCLSQEATEPSLSISPPHVKFNKIKVIELGQKLWHDSENKIQSLGSDDLKESVLFQLPKHGIGKETTFTITSSPSSDIYIAYIKDEDFNFGSEWTKINGSVSYNSTSRKPSVGKKEDIKMLIRTSKFGPEITNATLRTTMDGVKFAIFLLEGKDDSHKNVASVDVAAMKDT